MMLRFWKSCYYFKVWMSNLLTVNALKYVLSALGTLWVAIEVTTYFFSNTMVFEQKTIHEILRNAWPFFGISGFLIAIWRCRPKLTISSKLNGRDVLIEIAIGDIFSFPGAIIIGSNTTFDTHISKELISKNSIQGIFTKKHYGDAVQLNSEVESGLVGITCEQLLGERKGKSRKYPMGQCVRLNPKHKTAYLVAIADVNEHGVASSTFNNLKEALAGLWVFIGQRGLIDPLVVPALGTGFSRLPQTREEIVREIIKSFLAACSERTFTDKLTIVLHPQDVTKHRISLTRLDNFLRHQCDYTFYSTGEQQAIGTPVEKMN